MSDRVCRPYSCLVLHDRDTAAYQLGCSDVRFLPTGRLTKEGGAVPLVGVGAREESAVEVVSERARRPVTRWSWSAT